MGGHFSAGARERCVCAVLIVGERAVSDAVLFYSCVYGVGAGWRERERDSLLSVGEVPIIYECSVLVMMWC